MRNRLRLTLCLTLLATLACSSGCARRSVVFVQPGTDAQLAEDVEAHVWVEVLGKNGEVKRVRSDKRVKLNAGLWIVSDPDAPQ